MTFDPSKKNTLLEKKIELSFSKHDRLSEFERLVYPVVSRRSGGLSLGINLNPSKKCTFDCVYCQVDRSIKISHLTADLEQIRLELEFWLSSILENDNQYQGHSLRDISIAGDGEPTTVPILPDILKLMIELRLKYRIEKSKLILFTNGSNIHRNDIEAVLPDFMENNGEIWIKLDYWNPESLRQINRTKVSVDRLISNIVKVGKRFPLVLQSCFFCWGEEPFSVEKYEKYSHLVKSLLKKGTQIDRIQAYTLARIPAENKASPWAKKEMDRLVEYLRKKLPVTIEKYYSTGKEQ